jgi:hypothetical protein
MGDNGRSGGHPGDTKRFKVNTRRFIRDTIRSGRDTGTFGRDPRKYRQRGKLLGDILYSIREFCSEKCLVIKPIFCLTNERFREDTRRYVM